MPSRLFRFQLEDMESRQMLAFGSTIYPTFGSFGVAEAAIPGRLAMVAEVAGGKVLGVGTELADPPTHLVVFRWTPNGTPDETFGTHGQITSIGVETVDA